MAIQEVTSPPFLDDTAQTMVTKLENIKNAINPNAQGVSYSNTTSGLSATQVQAALDEIDGNVDTLSNSLTYKIVNITNPTLPTGVELYSANYYQKIGRLTILTFSFKCTSATKINHVISNYITDTDDEPLYTTIALGDDGDTDGISNVVKYDPVAHQMSFYNNKTGTTYIMGQMIYISKDL